MLNLGTCDHCGAQTVDGSCTKVMELKFRKVTAGNAHWKDPIDAVVMHEELTETLEAIRFYTATEPTWEKAPRRNGIAMIRVCSIGYRAGPAGP